MSGYASAFSEAIKEGAERDPLSRLRAQSAARAYMAALHRECVKAVLEISSKLGVAIKIEEGAGDAFFVSLGLSTVVFARTNMRGVPAVEVTYGAFPRLVLPSQFVVLDIPSEFPTQEEIDRVAAKVVNDMVAQMATVVG